MRSSLVLGVAWLLGCGADPVPPTVSIISQAPSTIVLGVDDEDDVSLRLAYEDGDGDIGGGVVHVHDCRDSDGLLELPIPTVASPEIVEQQQSITGELIALVPDISAAPSGATPANMCSELGVVLADDELIFCIVIEDNAKQQSTGVCSAVFALAGP
jgi:hypothetical protein